MEEIKKEDSDSSEELLSSLESSQLISEDQKDGGSEEVEESSVVFSSAFSSDSGCNHEDSDNDLKAGPNRPTVSAIGGKRGEELDLTHSSDEEEGNAGLI